MTKRDDLKARANELGLEYPGNASNDHLADLIAKAEQSTPVAQVSYEVLRVVGPAKGFRRAGRAFGAKAVDIAIADLSADELALLEREPRLITQRISLPE